MIGRIVHYLAKEGADPVPAIQITEPDEDGVAVLCVFDPKGGPTIVSTASIHRVKETGSGKDKVVVQDVARFTDTAE